MTTSLKVLTTLVVISLASGLLLAQRGPGGVPARDSSHERDHDVFHFLLDHHGEITRTVKELPNGVSTLTESDNPDVTSKIQEHVKWMQYRVEKNHPIRRRDPLFAELFKHAEKIKMKHEKTKQGVRVTETSDDPYVVKLIQAHAKTVSAFVERGYEEAHKNHPIPVSDNRKEYEYHHPRIKTFGKVVTLPDGAHQPRDGSKILVDMTAGGEPDKLFPSIEKVARFINIYGGAGKQSRDVKIAVVLHGDATLSVLNDEAYAKHFKTKSNPNLECLRTLHHEGVEIYVCGQSLIGKGGHPDDVVVFCDVAVSGLTAIVNLQEDGYRYLPMLKY